MNSRVLVLSIILVVLCLGLVVMRPSEPAARQPKAVLSSTERLPEAVPDPVETSDPVKDAAAPSATLSTSAQDLAARMRAAARADRQTMEELIRELSDSELPKSRRVLAALVLGTIDDAGAQEALAEALRGSRDPEWTMVLLQALGADKSADRDDIFDLPDTPFVREIGGLRLRIRTVLRDEAIRQLVSGFTSDPNVEIRRSAARALVHSTEFADLRPEFRRLVRDESDDGIRAGYAQALAGWLAQGAEEAPDRPEVMHALLEAVARPDDSGVRFLIEEPLQRASMTPAEMNSIVDLAKSGTLYQQIWSLSVLTSKMELGGAALEEAVSNLAGHSSESKVREYAVAVVAEFRTDAARNTLEGVLRRDPDWSVRAAAARGLIRHPLARSALWQAVQSDPNDHVREAAARTLYRLGPE